MLLACGTFLFVGVGWELKEILHQSVFEDIPMIKDRNGDDLVNGVMEWVRAVQFCALQDLAAHHPLRYDDGSLRWWLLRLGCVLETMDGGIARTGGLWHWVGGFHSNSTLELPRCVRALLHPRYCGWVSNSHRCWQHGAMGFMCHERESELGWGIHGRHSPRHPRYCWEWWKFPSTTLLRHRRLMWKVNSTCDRR